MRTVEYTDEDWLPIAFVAGLLAVSPATLRRLHAAGRLAGRRQPRDPRFTGPVGLPRPVLHLRPADVLAALGRAAPGRVADHPGRRGAPGGGSA